MWCAFSIISYINARLIRLALDFVVTIPFSFIAERYGVRVVLWSNLLPRIFMSIWAITIGYFSHILPVKAIIVGPFLALLGGECVLQSTIFTLTSALAGDYVQRYVDTSIRYKPLCQSDPLQSILLLIHQFCFVCRVVHGSYLGGRYNELEHMAAFLDQYRSVDLCSTYNLGLAQSSRNKTYRVLIIHLRE